MNYLDIFLKEKIKLLVTVTHSKMLYLSARRPMHSTDENCRTLCQLPQVLDVDKLSPILSNIVRIKLRRFLKWTVFLYLIFYFYMPLVNIIVNSVELI